MEVESSDFNGRCLCAPDIFGLKWLSAIESVDRRKDVNSL